MQQNYKKKIVSQQEDERQEIENEKERMKNLKNLNEWYEIW